MGDSTNNLELVRFILRGGGGSFSYFVQHRFGKIIRDWKKGLKWIQIWKQKENPVIVKGLAFADDIAILTSITEEAREALENMHDTSSKTGLQIYHEQYKFKDMDTKSTD